MKNENDNKEIAVSPSSSIDLLGVSLKTKECLASAMCPSCGKKPESVEPLPPGWFWDSLEPDNYWVWGCDCIENVQVT